MEIWKCLEFRHKYFGFVMLSGKIERHVVCVCVCEMVAHVEC